VRIKVIITFSKTVFLLPDIPTPPAIYLTGTYGAMGGARANALPLPYYFLQK
jgi:hypothetical protein